VIEHLAGESRLARATFVLYSGDTYAAFARSLSKARAAAGAGMAAGAG
jgi:hypothetical protein